MLGVRGWFAWQPDPGSHEITQELPQEGTTNRELLRFKHPAAVWHFLDALKRYDKLPVEKVREIAVEVATVGSSGLDYASPEPIYTLKSLPDEKFTGLHLMCLMYAGFKRIAPEHELGMDLNEPFSDRPGHVSEGRIQPVNIAHPTGLTGIKDTGAAQAVVFLATFSCRSGSQNSFVSTLADHAYP